MNDDFGLKLFLKDIGMEDLYCKLSESEKFLVKKEILNALYFFNTGDFMLSRYYNKDRTGDYYEFSKKA